MNLLLIILADATPSAAALYDWLIVLGFLVGIGVGVKTLLSRKPAHGDLATKDELKEIQRDLHDGLESLRREMNEDDDKIHRRVGAMTIKLATVDGKLDEIGASVRLLVGKEVGK